MTNRTAISGEMNEKPTASRRRRYLPWLGLAAALALMFAPSLAFGQELSIDFGDETTLTERAIQLIGLITLLSLVLLGPDVIFGFSAAITFGIFVGTYSSIFMSTPILIWLGVTGDSFVPRETSVEIQDRKARGEA